MWWIRRSMMATGRWLPTRRAKPKRWSGATLLPETWPMQRSEVWWVEFDPAVGSEIRKTRPAVIVSNNAANRNLARMVVVPLTSNTGRQYPGETVVTVGEQSSKAMVDQIMAAEKARLIFFFQAEDGIRDDLVTGVQTCALLICLAGILRPLAEFDRRRDRGARGDAAGD